METPRARPRAISQREVASVTKLRAAETFLMTISTLQMQKTARFHSKLSPSYTRPTSDHHQVKPVCAPPNLRAQSSIFTSSASLRVCLSAFFAADGVQCRVLPCYLPKKASGALWCAAEAKMHFYSLYSVGMVQISRGGGDMPVLAQ